MKKEQSQNYPFVITYLSNRYRLIECRDRIQWILQRRDKNFPRWRGIYYFRNTQSMSRIFRQFDLDDGVVGQLPERFESCFKTVQREQTKSDGVILATDRNSLEEVSPSRLEGCDGPANSFMGPANPVFVEGCRSWLEF